jgi:AAT family amino acid transporter
MVPWFVVLVSQLKFRAVHKQALKTHPFKSLLFPYANYLTIAFLLCVLVGMGINPDTRISLLVGGIFIAAVSLIYVGAGMHKRRDALKNSAE